MKCSNCGTELREGEPFCAICGQPVSGQTDADKQDMGTNQAQAVDSQMQSTEKAKKPKKSTGFKIGIAVLIVAVLAVGVAAGAKVISGIKKATMSPAEYYQYVETKNRDEGKDVLTGYYDAFRKSFARESFSKKVNMKLDISDTAKSLLALSGVDFSKVEDVELDIAAGKDKKTYSSLLKVRANDQDLVTLKNYIDLENKNVYTQIPELSESYLDASASFEEMENSSGASLNALFALYDFENVWPTTEALETLYERYTDLVIQSAENVEKSEGGCEAEGISQKAEKYTVTLNGEEAAKLVEDILKELKDDKEIKEIIENVSESAYDELTAELENSITELEDEVSTEEFSLVMEAQISSDEKIIGRNITIKDDSDEIVISIMNPKDGNQFGYEMAVTVNDVEYANIHGKGTEKSGVVNGEFALDMDESLNEDTTGLASTDNVLVVVLEDYDISGLKDGKVSGTITYSTESAAEFANYSLRVESEGDMENATGKISILAGKDELVTIDMTVESDVEIEEVKPADGDTVYDASSQEDMLRYQSEIDTIQFIQDLQDKLGIDLEGVLGGFLLGAAGSGDYSNIGDLSDTAVPDDLLY